MDWDEADDLLNTLVCMGIVGAFITGFLILGAVVIAA